MDALKLRSYVFEFSKEKDTAVTKTSEAPSSVTTTTEEEKGNVKFAVGTTFNREKTGDSLTHCTKIELVVKTF